MGDPQSVFWPGFDKAFKSRRFLKPNPSIHALSTTSVLLEMFFGEQILAKGTRWFWRRSDGVAVVTAWHNLSGLHHTLRKPLGRTGGLPDRIRFRFMTKNPRTLQDTEVPLYLDEERTQPRWFVHPDCGSFLDMAFLSINFSGADVNCVNDLVQVQSEGSRPAHDVFAIGYPQGINMLSVFPIWKRGAIASDPDVPVDGHPKFYVDMAGRGGLSGAPVFRIQQGVVLEPSAAGQDISFGDKMEFLGLYSGRAADQLPPDARAGESSDLGFVWRSAMVLEMLNGGVLDEQPEVGKGKVEITNIWQKADSP